MTDWFVAGVH